jgi:putative effector of murein hydrolase
MDPEVTNNGINGIVLAFIISLMSGFISISRRIMSGHPASALWVITEFCAAILCGYLMHNAYPHLLSYIPEWFTLPVAIAIAAHIGGRVFQELESEFIRRYIRWFSPGPPAPPTPPTI